MMQTQALYLPASILVAAPHPDDEILMCAGVIRRALAQNVRISVAIVTNGDYLCPNETKGSRRLSESLESLRLLGLDEQAVYFLGYPDTGMEKDVSFLNRLYNEKNPSRVFATERGSETYGIIGGKQDFSYERNGCHALYTKEAFLQDISALLQKTQPQLVITSSRFDVHGDHSALFYFLHDAVTQIKENPPELWESLIHSPSGDDKWPVPGSHYDAFTMPPSLESDTGLQWAKRIRVPLPEDMLCQPLENHLKYKAIQMHKSALKWDEEPEVVQYLLAFAKNEEIFWSSGGLI